MDGWAHSVKQQLLKAPKFYFFDCGVLNSLNGELRTDLKQSSFRYGELFETLVVQELHAHNSYQDLGLRFNYWRNKNGREVDVIVSKSLAKPIAAIEIKSSTKPSLEDVAGLETVSADYPKIKQWCLCRTENPYKLGAVEFLPWKEGLRRLADL